VFGPNVLLDVLDRSGMAIPPLIRLTSVETKLTISISSFTLPLIQYRA
jgi:hypothetical protein